MGIFWDERVERDEAILVADVDCVVDPPVDAADSAGRVPEALDQVLEDDP